MNKHCDRQKTAAELAALQDEDIDFTDIPELDDAFWQEAELVFPEKTRAITIRVKESVLSAYKAGGKGYQTRMNAVLESYARSRLMK